MFAIFNPIIGFLCNKFKVMCISPLHKHSLEHFNTFLPTVAALASIHNHELSICVNSFL